MAVDPPLVRRIAFLAFPRLTLLDLVGVYDALRRVGPMRPAGEVTHRTSGVLEMSAAECAKKGGKVSEAPKKK